MHATLDDLVRYCDARTRRAAYQDAPGAFNGLQVANSGRATKIGAAVDAGLVTFQRAAASKIDFLIVHHGMYWDMPRPITGTTHARLATLMQSECALYSCHLPLDGHPEIGNNALLARQLGLVPQRPFLMRGGEEPTGWIAPAATDRAGLRKQLESLYGRVVALEYGSTTPAEIAFCSGSGNSAVNELRPAGVDTLVTGELREEWFTVAQEQRLNLYLCGHYATEMHGVRALAAELAAKFNLPWEFVASENPL